MIHDEFEESAGDNFDWPLLILAALIAVVGVVNLYSATSVYTHSRASLYVTQVYFLVAGGAVASLIAAIDYRHIERFGYVLYVIGILSLCLVFVLGKGIRGSHRWIKLGGLTVQPSEFMKFFIIIAIAKYLQEGSRSEQARPLKDLIVPGLLIALPVGLVMKQPDLGTSLILALTSGSMVALLRVRWQSSLKLVGMGLGSAVIYVKYLIKDYQMKRINTFLNPEADVTGDGYHAHHARIAIGNGGLFGQGYMRGTQNQYYFLPDQYTDFPFPVLAEDWGFAGAVVLILLYALLVLKAVSIASHAKDRFGAAAAIGAGALIFWHAVFNLGMVTGVLPVVGVTLPLFSYGGSSALTMMMSLGLLMSISMRRNRQSSIHSSSMMYLR